jgi:hypothetical protein
VGALIGLLFGVGVLLIWRARTVPSTETGKRSQWLQRREEMLRQAGVAGVAAPDRTNSSSAARPRH